MATLTALALVVLGACSFSFSTSKDLDTAKAEREIKEGFERLYGTSVQRVDCPDREAKEGDVFNCTARIADQPLGVKVTQADGKGNIRFEPTQAVLDLEKAVSTLDRAISEQVETPVRVDCGPQRYVVKDVGTTFDCQTTAVSGGPSRRLEVTVKDVEGNVSYQLA